MNIKVSMLTIYALLDLKLVSTYLYPYESESRETKSLNGLWDFVITPEFNVNKGFKDNWHRKDFLELGVPIKMPVPASFNDITTNTTIRDYVGWMFYQRSFLAPKRWLQDDIRVFIHFGSVHYWAFVFLNGEKIGDHEGGHLPFQIELPGPLLSTYNSITVAVNNVLTPDTVPQGELTYPNNSMKYPPGYKLYSHLFDYFDYAGINRPVTLFTTPKVFISEIKITTDIHKEIGKVIFSVIPEPKSHSNATKCYVRLYDKTHTLVAQAAACQGTLVVHNAQLWWPVWTCKKTPGYLYNLEVTMKAEDSDPDVYTLPVGIRTVSWTNSSLLINNKTVYLRGFGMHEDSDVRGRGFDFAVMSRDLNLLSWIGVNTFRTSHYPYAEETLNQADALGILVILEVPACSLKGFNKKLYTRHSAYLEEMVNIHKNRPSVIMWSLANEPFTNSEQANYYFGNLSIEARAFDSARPITFVSSQPVANETAAHHMDVVCVNRYAGWYQDPGHSDLIVYQVTNEMTAWHNKYNRPVIVTEYGAGAISGLHTLPESMWSEDYQTITHLKHFEAFDKLRASGAIAGEMMWNFIDFNTPQEYIRPGRCSKGLFTRERQPKLAAHTVRSRYLALATCPEEPRNMTFLDDFRVHPTRKVL